MKILKIICSILLIPTALVILFGMGIVMMFAQGSGSTIDDTEEIVKVEGEFVGPYADDLYTITSDIGNRPLENSTHQGIDVSKGYGAIVIALTDAKVYTAKNTCAPQGGFLGNSCPYMEISGGGNYVVLSFEHEDKEYYVSYLHLSEINVQKGQMVKKGQVIGKEGHSGNSSGSHLHVEIHYDGLYVGSPINWINPRKFLKIP